MRRTTFVPWIVCLVLGFMFVPTLSEAVVEGIPCTPEPTDMIITYGDLVACSIDSVGDSDVYRFSGNSGEIVEIWVTAPGGSPCIELVAPDKTSIVECSVASAKYIYTTLSQTGTHTILITGGYGTAPEYTLALERHVPPSSSARLIQYGMSINDEINPLGDIDLFFFEGTTGDTIAIQATAPGGIPCIELVAPDSTRLVECSTSSSNRIDTTLNQTGTHTILVRGKGSTPTYTLSLQCLAGACVIVPTPDISGCIYLQGQPLPNRKVILRQPYEVIKTTTTDTDGCYEFENAVSGKRFDVIIKGPIIP